MSPKADKKRNVSAIVLGGGRGTRLHPLTEYRSKPAVPLAGKYRLIDVPISNCINSGIRRIHVLTQFNSASLNRHVAMTYNFDQFSRGMIEILAAEQTPQTEKWFQGTADAVRRNLRHVTGNAGSHVLILSGDALYRQDYGDVIDLHDADQADITVVCKLVSAADASSFGIVGIDGDRRITSFHEKPSGEKLGPLKASSEMLEKAGFAESVDKPYLASMGIYLFNKEVLTGILSDNDFEDFGKQIIPSAIKTRRAFAHLFDGYWEDIGTIRSFFHANLDLLLDDPPFSFYDHNSPIFTHNRLLPSSEILDSNIGRAMIGEGCLIQKADIRNSIIGIRSIIREGASLENTIMMGADYYDRETGAPDFSPGEPPTGIGENSMLCNAIVDKNARIGRGVRIICDSNRANITTPMFSVCDGIVIIPKSAVIPDGTVI
ncbi:MAG: glucose-1-phosphate adenylyltransferase [Verrucomicrobiota bacterium]